MRQKANKAFHAAFESQSPEDWDKHRAARRAFKKALRQSKRETWRDFYPRTEGTHESSRLYKIVGHSPVGKRGMLQLPNGT